MIWYTEAWSLDPVTISRLLEDTSQHMTEEVSGTWEGWAAQQGGAHLTFPLNLPVSSNTVPVGLGTGTPGLSSPPALPAPPPTHPGTWNTMDPVGML